MHKDQMGKEGGREDKDRKTTKIKGEEEGGGGGGGMHPGGKSTKIKGEKRTKIAEKVNMGEKLK